jgi:hypothetical protein
MMTQPQIRFRQNSHMWVCVCALITLLIRGDTGKYISLWEFSKRIMNFINLKHITYLKFGNT